jgi:hypothetical protein
MLIDARQDYADARRLVDRLPAGGEASKRNWQIRSGREGLAVGRSWNGERDNVLTECAFQVLNRGHGHSDIIDRECYLRDGDGLAARSWGVGDRVRAGLAQASHVESVSLARVGETVR